MKKHTLEYTVFFSGAVIMILELTGSRLLAPYLGTSIYVWTSLIGVILASLSVGSWFGGKFADTEARDDVLSFILFLGGIAILAPALAGGLVLHFVSLIPIHLRWRTFLSALILLTPPSVLLGMVTPYATRLKLENLESSGKTVGHLYAISTAGSIFGTFLAGFYLIAWLGTVKLLLTLSLSLILFSVFAFWDQRTKTRVGLVVFIAIITSGQFINQKSAEAEGFFDTDTEYNRVVIENTTLFDKPVRVMHIAGEVNSAIFLDDSDLALPYTKYYRLAKHFNPNINSALMLGGGGYSYPKDFLSSFPEATMDVVEIDPKITELAKKYFNLKDNARLTIYNEDGRTFLNHTTKKYDAIYNDAFSSFYTIPYQLTTKEAAQRMSELLNDNGVVMINLISSLAGEKSAFLAAEYKTFKEVFPQVYIFPVVDKKNSEIPQNIMLVAMKSNEPPALDSDDAELTHYLLNFWPGILNKDAPLLTDDFAPVDQLVAPMAKNR